MPREARLEGIANTRSNDNSERKAIFPSWRCIVLPESWSKYKSPIALYYTIQKRTNFQISDRSRRMKVRRTSTSGEELKDLYQNMSCRGTITCLRGRAARVPKELTLRIFASSQMSQKWTEKGSLKHKYDWSDDSRRMESVIGWRSTLSFEQLASRPHPRTIPILQR